MICEHIKRIVLKLKEKISKHKKYARVHAYDRGMIDGLKYSIDVIDKEINNGKKDQE